MVGDSSGIDASPSRRGNRQPNERRPVGGPSRLVRAGIGSDEQVGTGDSRVTLMQEDGAAADVRGVELRQQQYSTRRRRCENARMRRLSTR
jgi:hypothetical protein